MSVITLLFATLTKKNGGGGTIHFKQETAKARKVGYNLRAVNPDLGWQG